jgi:uncharacterized protein
MSQENVDRVREGYERWAAKRELNFELIHPDVEWVFIDLQGQPRSFHGHDGFHQWLQEMRQGWEDLWWEPERLVDAHNHVVAVVTAHLRGRGSGIDLDVPLGNLWTIRDGLVVRFQMFLDPTDAFEAAGLSE